MKPIVILIPTYNERANIERLVPEVFAAHPNLSILVIDDNSPDGTADTVRTMQNSFSNLELLLRQNKQGLGAAYKHGMREALKDPNLECVVMMDADGSHAVEHLSALLAASERADFVVGSRYVEGGSIEDWEPWRYALSGWGNRYARVITGLPVHDLTGGFNCIRADLLRRIDLDAVSASGYAFQMELKFFAIYEHGGRAEEVPIHFRVRREGESKISSHIIREGLRTPWRLLGRRLRNVQSYD